MAMGQVVIAIDPGKDKCGIAVVHKEEGVLFKQVISTRELNSMVEQLVVNYKSIHVLIGDRTTSQETKKKLEQLIFTGKTIEVILVDEHRSTDQARERYWREHPPRGIMKLIPTTMQVPPRPVDDYVAVILAERYFALLGK